MYDPGQKKRHEHDEDRTDCYAPFNAVRVELVRCVFFLGDGGTLESPQHNRCVISSSCYAASCLRIINGAPLLAPTLPGPHPASVQHQAPIEVLGEHLGTC